ncbi:MAG: hypothetical protein L6Q40_07450 [Azonexus sp.]|nr:hypothetical protein [Azonexus sp.]
MTLDVTYCLNGENATEMVGRLRRMCERAIGEGMLTGETDAEVDEMRERMELAKEETSSWAVTLTMENGTMFNWTGEADDQDHAEGQAIAEAVAKTGEQVLEVVRANKC